jgi:hypothetical protein
LVGETTPVTSVAMMAGFAPTKSNAGGSTSLHPETALAEIRRVLSSSGRLVLGLRDRTDDAATHFPASVYRFYSGDEVAVLLGNAGFASVDVRTAAADANLRVVVATAK